MPASRRARAMTWRRGRDRRVRASPRARELGGIHSALSSPEHVSQRSADLSDCGIGAHGIQQGRHQIGAALSASPQVRKSPVHAGNCGSPEAGEAYRAGRLPPRRRCGACERPGVFSFLRRLKAIHSHHNGFTRFHAALVFVTAARDLVLRKSFFDGRDHPSHFIDVADVFVSPGFEIESEPLQKQLPPNGSGHGGEYRFRKRSPVVCAARAWQRVRSGVPRLHRASWCGATARLPARPPWPAARCAPHCSRVAAR